MGKQEQVEQALERIISQGRWRLLDKLPPERTLALELCVSRNTLRTALRSLCGRGILEVRPGKGTIVRTLPPNRPFSTSLLESLRLKTEAFMLVMPPLAMQCAFQIKPSNVLALEMLLPKAGIALRSYNIRDFSEIQATFFIKLIDVLNNTHLTAMAMRIIPEGKELVKLLGFYKLARSEPLFSTLARLLNAMRHVEPQQAVDCTSEYAAIILLLLKDIKSS